MFSCETCKVFKYIFFTEDLWWLLLLLSEYQRRIQQPRPEFVFFTLLVKRCAGNDALEANAKLSQASKMKLYTKIVNGNCFRKKIHLRYLTGLLLLSTMSCKMFFFMWWDLKILWNFRKVTFLQAELFEQNENNWVLSNPLNSINLRN